MTDMSLFRRTVPGEFEVCVLKDSLVQSEAKLYIECYETDETHDIALKKNDSDTIKLAIPYCIPEKFTKSELEKRIIKCLETIVATKTRTVAVNIDAVKTWNTTGFVYTLLKCFHDYAHTNPKWAYLRLTLCSTQQQVCESAKKACAELLSMLNDNASEDAEQAVYSANDFDPSKNPNIGGIKDPSDNTNVYTKEEKGFMTGSSTQRQAEDSIRSPKTDSSRSSKAGGSGAKPGGLSSNTEKSPHQHASMDTAFCFEDEIFGTSTRALTFNLSSTQMFHVYSEDLLGTTMPKVDMLVCSDNSKAAEKGYLVGTLRSIAGKKYRDDKDKAFKKTGLKHGEVIVCNGGYTRYKYIAVAVIDVFSVPLPESEKKVKYLALYRNIFKTAVEKRIGSVALSALGTGSGTMNPEVSIEMFAGGLLDFFKQNKTQKLCVHFVNKKTEIKSLAKTLIQQTWNMRPKQHVNIGAPGHAKSSDARSEINENSMFQDQMAEPQMRKQSNDSSPTNNLKENVDGKHINQRRTSTFARSMSIPSTVPAEHKTDSNPKRFSASLMVQHGDFDPSMLASQIPKGGGGGNLPMFETYDNQSSSGSV